MLTQDAGVVKGYFNGALEFTANSNEMVIDANNLFNFFLDDAVIGFGEYSDSSVALIRLYNGALSASDVEILAGSPLPNPQAPGGGVVPEPGALGLLAAGLAPVSVLGAARRRRRAA